MLRVVADEKTSAELVSGLDEIVREGARRMLAIALEAEVDAYVSAFVDEVDGAGKRGCAQRPRPRALHRDSGWTGRSPCAPGK